jgi:T5SS/PEP-CTERM-associated repeat protein
MASGTMSQLAMLFAAMQASAADSLWDNVNGGVFTLASNWFGGVPGPNDVARFETTNSNLFQQTYAVSFANDPTNQQLVVEDDNVAFNLIGSPSNHTYTLSNQFVAVALGTVAGRSGNLTVNRGTLNLPSKNATSAPDLEIAPVANASGVLTVGVGGGVVGGPDVFVGLNGNGTLDINSGGDLSATLVDIGVNGTSTGKATIMGDGSSLSSSSLSSILTVGDFGNGELHINNGGDVVGFHAVIGRGTDSIGVANVLGSGSTWSVRNLVVGGNGDFGALTGFAGLGTLNITGGGQVTSNFATLGSSRSSTGQVNVASTILGAGSAWTVDGDLFIAIANEDTGGTGTLLIQTGGTVSVTGETRLGTEGLVRLEGGTFRSNKIFLGGAEERFSWTAGTLQVGFYNADVTVPNGGVLAPVRSASGTTIQGNYNQQAGGATLAVEIGGPFRFTDYGVVTSFAAVLGGNLQLTLTDGFVPTALNSFDILEADGGVTGAFANVANGQRLVATNGLGSFLVNYGPGSPFNPTHVMLSDFLPITPGDFDFDGDVDGRDFLVWQRGGSPTPLSAADLADWRTNFEVGSSTAAIAAPEPNSASGCVIVMWACVNARRRSVAKPMS